MDTELLEKPLHEDMQNLIAGWASARIEFADRLINLARSETLESREAAAKSVHEIERGRFKIARRILDRPDAVDLSPELRQSFEQDIMLAPRIELRHQMDSAAFELIERYTSVQVGKDADLFDEERLNVLANAGQTCKALYTLPSMQNRFYLNPDSLRP